jgi:hypothetical protein
VRLGAGLAPRPRTGDGDGVPAHERRVCGAAQVRLGAGLAPRPRTGGGDGVPAHERRVCAAAARCGARSEVTAGQARCGHVVLGHENAAGAAHKCTFI